MYIDRFIFTIEDILKCLHNKREFIRSLNDLRVLRITNPSENLILVTEYNKSNKPVYSITLKLLLSFGYLKLSVVSVYDKHFKDVPYSSTFTEGKLTIDIKNNSKDIDSFDIAFKQGELLRAALRLMDTDSPNSSIEISTVTDPPIKCYMSKAYNMAEVFRISFMKEINGEDKTIFFYIRFDICNNKSFGVELSGDEAYVNNDGKMPIKCIFDPDNITHLHLKIN